MARPEAYERNVQLSDAEKRELIALIQAGKPLPEKCRFLLFEDKREVELVWNGKSRDVCTTVLPFQTLEHIDEPRNEAPEIQGNLFDPRGRQIKGWTYKLIWGDNKLILSSLKSGALRRQSPRVRGALDRRLHFRERVAELPHAAGSQAGADFRSAYLYENGPLHGGSEGHRHIWQRHGDPRPREPRLIRAQFPPETHK